MLADRGKLLAGCVQGFAKLRTTCRKGLANAVDSSVHAFFGAVVLCGDRFGDDLANALQSVTHAGQLSHQLTGLVIAVHALHSDAFDKAVLDAVPTLFFVSGQDAHQFFELQHICFVVGCQRLGVLLVGADDQTLKFLIVHDAGDLFGHPVHVSVGTLQLEWRFGSVRVRLCSTADVGTVDSQDDVADTKQFFHHFVHLANLIHRKVAFQRDPFRRIALCGGDDRSSVCGWRGAKRRERSIAGQAVFQVTRLESVGTVANDFAQVVDIRSVGKHVWDLETLS